jgi:putative oxidoreductase
MNKILSVLGRVLIAQLFLVQVVFLILSFKNNPNGYLEYQMALGQHGLPGIFAPLTILIQLLGGLALLLGYKTRVAALSLALYALIILVLAALSSNPFSSLAVVGGLLAIAVNPDTPFSLDNLKK